MVTFAVIAGTDDDTRAIVGEFDGVPKLVTDSLAVSILSSLFPASRSRVKVKDVQLIVFVGVVCGVPGRTRAIKRNGHCVAS